MDERHSANFLGHDRIFPLILKMGIPTAVGMLVNALYNVVDTIFVGQGVGSLAIAALAIVFPVQMLVSSIAQAIGFGGASIVSRRLGEKKPEDAAAAIGTAYSAVFMGTAVLVVLFLIFLRPILTLFGSTETIMPYALDYGRIVGFGFLFFSLSMAANSLVRSEGNARESMIGMVIGAGLNCFLDPLFIFGFHWGVKGAAIATVISQLSSCIYLFSVYARGKTHIALKLSDFRIRGDILRESTILGIPAFVQEAGMSVLAMVVNNSLKFYGGDTAISIYGMVSKFSSIIFLPMLGIIQGFQPIAGYNYGARRYDRVKESLRVAIFTAMGCAALGYVFTEFVPSWSMSLFTQEKSLIAASARVLRMMQIFFPLVAIQIVGTTYFQAVGKPKPALVLGLSRQFIILIPLVLVLPHFYGLDGVWLSFPGSDLLSTMLTLLFLLISVRGLDEADSVRHDEGNKA